VDLGTLEPLARLDDDGPPALLALAARVGEVRLIDNIVLTARGAASEQTNPEGEAIQTCSA